MCPKRECNRDNKCPNKCLCFYDLKNIQRYTFSMNPNMEIQLLHSFTIVMLLFVFFFWRFCLKVVFTALLFRMNELYLMMKIKKKWIREKLGKGKKWLITKVIKIMNKKNSKLKYSYHRSFCRFLNQIK